MPIPNDQHLLDKSRKSSLHTQIVAGIRTWIKQGDLREGEALPPERELARIFQVSRIPVREALKVLQFLGVIQHLPGRGAVVQAIRIDQALSQLDFVMLNTDGALRDLFEVREALEVQAAGLASLRRTDQDLIEMENALVETEILVARDRDMSEASMHFHTAMMAAAHNEVTTQVDAFLLGFLRYSRSVTLVTTERRKAALNAHTLIFNKIKERDAEGARSATLQHLREMQAMLPEESGKPVAVRMGS